MTRLILSLAFSALLTAPALADDAVIPSVRSFASRTPPTPNLNGRWARLQVTTAVSKVPVLGDTTSETVGVVLLDIRQTDDRLKIRERVCGLRGESLGGIVKTRFPKGFLRALSGQRKSGVLKQTGERWTYEELEHTCVRGVSLDGPDEEPLPTDPTDPRIPGCRQRWSTWIDRQDRRLRGRRRLRHPAGLRRSLRDLIAQRPDPRTHRLEGRPGGSRRQQLHPRRQSGNHPAPRPREELLSDAPRSPPGHLPRRPGALFHPVRAERGLSFFKPTSQAPRTEHTEHDTKCTVRFLYLDDSGKAHPNAPGNVVVLAGLSIDENELHAFNRQARGAKQKFFPRRGRPLLMQRLAAKFHAEAQHLQTSGTIICDWSQYRQDEHIADCLNSMITARRMIELRGGVTYGSSASNESIQVADLIAATFRRVAEGQMHLEPLRDTFQRLRYERQGFNDIEGYPVDSIHRVS